MCSMNADVGLVLTIIIAIVFVNNKHRHSDVGVISFRDYFKKVVVTFQSASYK